MKWVTFIIVSIFLLSVCCFAQDENSDDDKSVNYRRTETNQLLTTDYNKPKEEVFPLRWNTGTLGKVTTGTGVWTELNPKVPRVDYIGLDFVNPDTGWACGGSGAVIKTTNGGNDWTISETFIANLILKIHSYNGQVVIATGYDGLILRSSDGGENFTEIPSGVGSGTDLWGVQMVNDTLGWVCGMNQTLLKTTDGGLTWQFVNPGLNQHYWSLKFLTEQFGFVACGGGLVLKTTDGGTSWQQYQAGDTRALYTIDIIDTLHIAAAGGPFGKNVYSSNGGITWVQNTDLIYSEGANWIYFLNSDTGFATGDGTYLSKTTDRGQSWFRPPYYKIGRWQFELLSENIGYGVGDNLTLTKTEDGFNTGMKLILNDDFYDDYFFSETNGFILSGSLYNTTDGGMNWERIAGGPGGRCIVFTDEQTGFVGSINYSTIYKTIDGGDTWNETNITGLTDTIGSINKIFFINPTIGWAVTSRGGILKTTDVGDNWFAQLNVPFIIFSGIHFIDSLYGWTANGNARPYKTTDGGGTWVEQTNLTFWHTDDVYFTDYDSGWIIRDMGGNNLYKTYDAGITWNPVSDVIGAFRFHFFPDSQHWLINGSNRYITVDDGNTWIDITNDVPTGFNSFSAITDKLGYAVGNSGLILRYDDTTYVPVELISFEGRVEKSTIVLSWITASELNNYGFEIQRLNNKNHWEKAGFVPGKGTSTDTNYYRFSEPITYNEEISYRLKQIDYDGTYNHSQIITLLIDGSPLYFNLSQNFPNPFNSSTIISYQIPENEFVTLKIYDVLGNEISTLIDEKKEAGYYEIRFSADDLSTGIYFYKLTAGEYLSTKKFILLK